MGLDRIWNIALVGVGKLGSALLGYDGFKESGFNIRIGFDVESNIVGKKIAGVPVYHPYKIPKMVREQKIRMGIVAVPAKASQESIDLLVISGVEAILNFSPITVIAPSYVKLMQVDFTNQLEIMSYSIINKAKEETQVRLF